MNFLYGLANKIKSFVIIVVTALALLYLSFRKGVNEGVERAKVKEQERAWDDVVKGKNIEEDVNSSDDDTIIKRLREQGWLNK